MLRKMAGLGRRAPLSPEAFARLIATKEFTSGADSETVIELYRQTATDLLGSTKELKYEKLAWKAEDYQHLGEAVRYCVALEMLTLDEMEMDDAGAAATSTASASSETSCRIIYYKSWCCAPWSPRPPMRLVTSKRRRSKC